MPRILIAGCGYIGQVTGELFRKSGWEVEGWTLSTASAEKLSHSPFPVCAVDISSPARVNAVTGEFDWVIHCASSRGGDEQAYRRIYLDGAQNLLRRFPQARLLFTSSTSVYAQTDGSWVDETSAAQPLRETGKILRETEDVILEAGGTVVRVAGIYGPERSFLLQKFLAAEAVIDRQSDRYTNQVHRDDVAAAIFHLITSDCHGIYNVVDNEPMLLSACYDWLARELGGTGPAEGASARPRKRGDSNKRVSNKKLRSLGWMLRYPSFAEAMRESILPSRNLDSR